MKGKNFKKKIIRLFVLSPLVTRSCVCVRARIAVRLATHQVELSGADAE